GTDPRRDVLVLVDALALWEVIRDGQEAIGPDVLLREPAAGDVPPQRTLQSESAHRPLFLREHRIPSRTRVVDPRRDRLGELIRLAVVEAIPEVGAVG